VGISDDIASIKMKVKSLQNEFASKFEDSDGQNFFLTPQEDFEK